MSGAPPFGDGVLPALQTLLGHLEPHIKVLIPIFLVLNPYNALQGGDTALPSHPTVLLLVLLALYGEYLKIPGLEIPGTAPSTPAPAATAGTTPVPAAPLAESLLALYSIYNNLKTYFKSGFILWLTYYIYHQSPLFSQAWPFCLVPFGLVVLCYVSPTTRFYGPIRFGYLEYSEHFAQAYKVLLDWLIVLVVFLPFSWLATMFGAGIVVFSLAAWVRLSFSYRRELRAISSQVAKETSRARAAVAAAHDAASRFHRYEDQVTQPAQDAISKADELIEVATDGQMADKPDEDEEGGESHTERLARFLQETAEDAREKANDVVSQLKVAQEAVTRSNDAAVQDRRARAAAETNADGALAVTQRIGERAAGLLDAEAQVARHADEVATLAGQALSAARGGEMARARQIASAATTAADSADAALGLVRAARAAALEHLLQWLQSSRSGGS